MLPPVCVVCRAPADSHGLVCGSCFAEIDFISAPVCTRLGVPLPYDTGEPYLSAAAIAAPYAYDRARCSALYRDHEGPHPQSKISRSAGQLAPILSMAGAGGEGHPGRCRSTRTRSAVSVSAVVATIQSVRPACARLSETFRYGPTALSSGERAGRQAKWACRRLSESAMLRGRFRCRRPTVTRFVVSPLSWWTT